MSLENNQESAIGIIGGSGVYKMDELTDVQEISVDTPFGPPSDVLISGRLEGRRVIFLPRHGRQHHILPHEVNSRANMWALKSAGVDWILGFTAVGSLKEELKPRDVVIPDQYYDRTKARPGTFFGDGLVAHVSVADPYCSVLTDIVHGVCTDLSIPVHKGGTYICIEGPTFSTKAESAVNRSHGFSIVGMTNVPECKLAREAEMAYIAVSLVTDYDVWHESHDAVTVELVLENLRANAENVQKIVKSTVSKIPTNRTSPAHDALKGAIMTQREAWPEAVVELLRPIVSRYL